MFNFKIIQKQNEILLQLRKKLYVFDLQMKFGQTDFVMINDIFEKEERSDEWRFDESLEFVQEASIDIIHQEEKNSPTKKSPNKKSMFVRRRKKLVRKPSKRIANMKKKNEKKENP